MMQSITVSGALMGLLFLFEWINKVLRIARLLENIEGK